MAKDKNLAKLKSRFEVRGGLINEFDFHQNQGALAEEEKDRFARQEEEREVREGETEQHAPQSEAERIELMMAEAREKAEKNLRRKEKASKSNVAPRAGKKGGGAGKTGKSAAKAAPRKGVAAKKRGSARKGAQEGGAKKSAGKKRR